MRVEPMIVFDDEEQEAFSRLIPYRAVLGEDEKGKAVVGRFLSQVIRDAPRHVGGAREDESEPLSFETLGRFEHVLLELRTYLAPQRYPEWWRDQGAPGGDDAIEGLAAGRVRAVEDVDVALRIVQAARALAADAKIEAAAVAL